MLVFIAITLAVLAALLVLLVRRGSDTVDLGAVSTRWLSELRRDEPWSRS
jgi:hypothetical protein